jgi:hypothetical protein
MDANYDALGLILRSLKGPARADAFWQWVENRRALILSLLSSLGQIKAAAQNTESADRQAVAQKAIDGFLPWLRAEVRALASENPQDIFRGLRIAAGIRKRIV